MVSVDSPGDRRLESIHRVAGVALDFSGDATERYKNQYVDL